MDIKDLIIYRRTIPARKAIYSSFPESLNPKIVEFLRERGIDQLYCHQAQIYELAREGKNVVITTSTASGKTLSFLLPVIQEILEHPTARAIFIYPTKALAADPVPGHCSRGFLFSDRRKSVPEYMTVIRR